MFIPGIDEDVEMVSQAPQSTGSDRLDDAFDSVDFGLDETETTFTKRSSDDDAEIIVMNLPNKKVAKISRRQLQSCRTSQELKDLDKLLYRQAGLRPEDFGL